MKYKSCHSDQILNVSFPGDMVHFNTRNIGVDLDEQTVLRLL